MGIHPAHLLDYVISPTLDFIGQSSLSAKILLLATAAQESNMGFYINQLGNGGAVGLYQMEKATHDDIWDNFLAFRSELKSKVMATLCPMTSRYDNLKYNLAYSTTLTRIHYLRNHESIPDGDDVEKLANYWKTYYNTHLGKGTVSDFIRNYEGFGLGSIWNQLKGI